MEGHGELSAGLMMVKPYREKQPPLPLILNPKKVDL